jgi:hypothetical protein
VVDKYSADDMAKAGRLKQIRMVASLVHQQNRRALPITFGSVVGVMAVFVLVGLFTGMAAFLIPLGVLFGLLAGMILFGRFAQSAQYSAIEGQPGAAAAILQSMRGNWTVTPAVTANRNMDVVHRAVGRPGVVLVGEGAPSRLAGLIAAEKKKTARVAHDVPIFDFQVGNAEGQIPVSKLQRKIMRLPRNLRPAAISDLNYRLKALQPSLQAPKGPIPKNIRQPKMPRPRVRLLPHDDRVRGTVVQAAQVSIGQQRRHHEEQQYGAQQRPPEARPAAIGPDHPDAEEPLADGEPADRGEQVNLRTEHHQSPVHRAEVVRVARSAEQGVPGQAGHDDLRQQPVGDKRAKAPAHAGCRHRPVLRQAESLAGVGRRMISGSATWRDHGARSPRFSRASGFFGHRTKVSARHPGAYGRSPGRDHTRNTCETSGILDRNY